MRRAAPTLPINIETLASVLAERSSHERFRALLMGTVSLVAVILAACGVYGAAAKCVIQQRRDVTIRLALGAATGLVISGMLKNTIALCAVGLLLGLSVAYLLLKGLSGVLFGFSGLEAPAVAVCTVLILLVSSLSTYVPARRILRFQIADVLKEV